MSGTGIMYQWCLKIVIHIKMVFDKTPWFFQDVEFSDALVKEMREKGKR